MLLYENLCQFVELQRRLKTHVCKCYPSLSDDQWLLGLPKRFEFHLGEELWRGVKHGAGLQFIRKAPLPAFVVDMHEEPTNSERIDAWRIQQFLESLGQEIEFTVCRDKLHAAASAGILVEGSNGEYRLSNASNAT